MPQPTSKALAGTSAEDVAAFLKWAQSFDGVEAFTVYDYINLPAVDPRGHEGVAGAVNGVTIQWGIHDELVEETPDDEPNVLQPIAAGAVHVRVGGTATVSAEGFTVENPTIVTEAAQ